MPPTKKKIHVYPELQNVTLPNCAGPKANGWCQREGHVKKHREEGGHMEREAEMEVMHLQAKERQASLATTRHGTDSRSELQKELTLLTSEL